MNLFEFSDDNDNDAFGGNGSQKNIDDCSISRPEIGFCVPTNNLSPPIALIDDDPDGRDGPDDEVSSDKTERTNITANENETEEKASSSSDNKDDFGASPFDKEYGDSVDANIFKQPPKKEKKSTDDRIVDCIYCAFTCCECSIM